MPIIVDDTEPLATPTDLSDALLRPLTADETTPAADGTSLATRELARAESLLAGRVRSLHARVASWQTGGGTAIDPTVAASVIAGIVARKWRNPDGALNRSTTVGPYSETVGFGERVGGEQLGRGELVVTQGDIDALTTPVAFSPGGTIRTAPRPPFAAADCDSAWPGWRPGA